MSPSTLSSPCAGRVRTSGCPQAPLRSPGPWARRLPAVTLSLAALLAAGACDTPTSSAPAAAADAGPTADLISWAPDATGTTSAPVYGRCRLGAERVLWAASNGAPDDQISLLASGDGASLTVRVVDASGLVFEGDVTLDRALLDKSYRAAVGTARWAPEGLDAQVVDGTLCFSERLASGAPVDGEFSLVLATGAGSYASVSGSFHVAGEGVSTDPKVAVQGSAVDIDLR